MTYIIFTINTIFQNLVFLTGALKSTNQEMMLNIKRARFKYSSYKSARSLIIEQLARLSVVRKFRQPALLFFLLLYHPNDFKMVSHDDES